jgi:hypothetical protein
MMIETYDGELIINPIRIYFKQESEHSYQHLVYYNVYVDTPKNSYLIKKYPTSLEANDLIKRIKKFFSIANNRVFTQEMIWG